jgi:hypothetical protein
MSEGKQIKFEMVLDDHSFQRVRRAISELNSEAGKLAKTMASISGSGLFGGGHIGGGAPVKTGVGGSGAMAPAVATARSNNKTTTSIGSAILGDVEAFRKLAQSGKDGMFHMTDAVRRGVREQMSEIDRLERKLANLNKLWGKQRMGYGFAPEHQDAIQQRMMMTQGQLNSAQSSLNQLKSLDPSIEGPPTIAGMKIAPQGAGAWLKVGGMVAAGAAAALNEYMGGTRTYTAQESSRSALVNSDIRRLRSGDMTGMVALQDLVRDRDKLKDLAAQTGLGAQAEALKSGATEAALGLVRAADPTGLVGKMMGSSGGGILDPLSTASRNTGMASNALDQARQHESATAFLNKKMALESFYGNMGARKQGGRILGLGLNFDERTQEWVDSYGRLDAKMTNAGYSANEYVATAAQARNMGGGKFANKNASAMMAAQAAGYGGYGELLLGAEKSGYGTSAGYAMGSTNNIAAALALGHGVIGSGFDPRGTTSGIGLLSAAQGPGFNFTGEASDFLQINRLLAGAAMGSNITTGALDPYQAGRNIIGAIGINPGGSTYAQDYLGSGMSLKQLMDASRGNMTATGTALGLTSEMAKRQLSGSMSSILERFVDQGANDPMSRAIRGYQKSGQSIESYLKNLYTSGRRGEADAIGAFFGMVSGEGEEAGLGLAAILGGYDTKGRTKGGPGPGRGGMESINDWKVSETIKKNAETLATLSDDLVAAYSKSGTAEQAMLDFGGNLSQSAEMFMGALTNLALATDAVAYQMSGGALGKPLPEKSWKAVAKDIMKNPVVGGAVEAISPGASKLWDLIKR